LKCLGFTYNGAKLFNMMPIKIRKMEDPNTFILIIIIYSLRVI
jgi:hypothetical protein